MAVVALVVFLLLYLTPGDPAAILAGDAATNEDIRRIREKLGLDEPFLVRFGGWLWALLHGDLGTSIFTNLPVTHLIAQRIEPTLALTTCTLIVAVLVAVPLGVIAAARAGTWVDRSVMAFSVLGFSLPVFVLANLGSGVTSVIPDADLRMPGQIAPAPILAQMHRDAVGARLLGDQSCGHGVGIARVTRLPQCRDVIDIDA